MDRQEILADVKSILAPFARDTEALEAVTEESHILDDLKVNSARLVDVVLEFEDAFDVEIADEDVDAVETVGNAVDLILSKQG